MKLFGFFTIPSSVILLDGWDDQLYPISWECTLPYTAIYNVNVTWENILFSLNLLCETSTWFL